MRFSRLVPVSSPPGRAGHLAAISLLRSLPIWCFPQSKTLVAADWRPQRTISMPPSAEGSTPAAAAIDGSDVDDVLVQQALRQHSHIILGTSSSARRAVMDELAQQYGFQYEVAKADIDERAIRHVDAHQLVLRLAHAKAAAIAAMLEAAGRGRDGLLITCDQVVLHEGKILEKPENEAEAREFIAGYARAPASTVGSVVVTDLATRQAWEGVDVAQIHFEPLPAASVDALIAEGEVYWCAGGLMVEHPLVAPHVTRMDGTLDSVMGLSKRLLLRLLCQAAARQDSGTGASKATAIKPAESQS